MVETSVDWRSDKDKRHHCVEATNRVGNGNGIRIDRNQRVNIEQDVSMAFVRFRKEFVSFPSAGGGKCGMDSPWVS